MAQPLRVLVLEDDPQDFAIVARALQEAGFAGECRQAATHAIFTALLDTTFDIVIADYRLPDFTAMDALAEMRERHIDAPMIIVTGALGDEGAAACMRMGAVDFLLKDRLQRLGPAIRQALDARRELQARDAALRQSEQRFRDVAEVAGDMIWETDRDGRFTFVECSNRKIYGMTSADLVGTLHWEMVSDHEDQDLSWRGLKAVLEGHVAFRQFRYSIRSADGRRRHLSVNGKPFVDAQGRFAGFRGTTTDQTDEVEALDRAQASELQARLLSAELTKQHEMLQVTLQSIADGVITTDAKGRIVWLNPVAERLTGWPTSEALHHPLERVFRIIDAQTREPAENPVMQCLLQGRAVGLDRHTLLICRTGDEFGIENSASPLRNDQGETLGAVLVFHDVTEARQLSGEMSFRASHDMLTGLLNRTEFDVGLRFLLHKARADRSDNAMLFIDLDQFKLVNDSCGHHAGDQLLRQVSKLLTEAVRASDTLARLGGDEFGVILDHCSMDQAQRLAQRICDRMEDFRFIHGEHHFRIGASIGLVPVDDRWSNIADILHAADSACYAAKEAGRNRVHRWSESDKTMSVRQGETQLAMRLTRALDENSFQLFAQRIKPLRGDSSDDRVHAEVLLRMLGPDGSPVSPGAFLPAAERFHLASRIDRWVLRHAVAWLSQPASLACMDLLSVNLSGQSISDLEFHSWASGMLSDAGRAICERLCLEITETAAVTNPSDASVFIARVRSFGVRVALDDFGAGASSFGYLKTLPVDILKIDGQFIRDLVTDPLDEAAVRCFAEVASVVGLRTVAEFVDSDAVLAKLWLMGIDFAQGYLLHRPAPIDELLAPGGA